MNEYEKNENIKQNKKMKNINISVSRVADENRS